MTFTQEQFERLSSLMNDKGVIHEAFELLADLRQSERVAKQEVVAVTNSVVVALAGLTDFEGLPVSELNYLQVIRKLKTKIDKSYYYQKPKNSKPLFAGGHWNDTGNVRGFNPIDFGKLKTVEEFLRIRAEQKI